MSTKVSTGFGWLEDDVTGDPAGVRRHSDGKEFTIPLVETDPVTGVVKLIAGSIEFNVGTATPVPYSATIPMDGGKIMPRTIISAAVEFAVGAVVNGGQCVVPVVANGVIAPTFEAGFRADPNSDSWRSVAGALHKIYAWYEDDMAWYFLRDTGLTVAIPATGLVVSGPSTGIVNTASTAITVTANGSLASSVTVTPTADVAGTFSPASATLANGGSVNFTFTPTVSGSSTVTLSALGLSSAALAYSILAAATAPAQITSLTLGTPGATSQPLSWLAPSNGGSAITDYVVQYSTDDATWTTFADGASAATSATVTGLTESTLYYYRVGAANAVGTGAYSAAVSGSTTSAAAQPTVTRLTATVGLTEAGDATNGWNYTASASDGYTGAIGGITDKSIASAGDGSFQYTMSPFAESAASPFLGLKTSQAVGAFGTSAIGIYVSGTAKAYKLSTGSTGSQNPNGTVVAPASGDVVRLRRAGSSAYAEVSKNGGSTWTVLHTWTGITTAQVWGLVDFGAAAVGMTNLRGTGVA